MPFDAIKLLNLQTNVGLIQYRRNVHVLSDNLQVKKRGNNFGYSGRESFYTLFLEIMFH